MFDGNNNTNKFDGKPKTKQCKDWSSKGTCRFGDKCRFEHGNSGTGAATGGGGGGNVGTKKPLLFSLHFSFLHFLLKNPLVCRRQI